MPKGLPPLRGIEHQIDFVPGSTLPNRPAYKTNPIEAREIQKQVEELLEIGHIRESLSPYLAPGITSATSSLTAPATALSSPTIERVMAARIGITVVSASASEESSQGAGYNSGVHRREIVGMDELLSFEKI
nr:uncharacterized protein LOC109174301 [Ipomoea batatas]